jgi:hypothetical protein
VSDTFQRVLPHETPNPFDKAVSNTTAQVACKQDSKRWLRSRLMKKRGIDRINVPMMIIVVVSAVLSLMSCGYFYNKGVRVLFVFFVPFVLVASVPIAVVAGYLIPRTGRLGVVLTAVLLWTIAAFSWQGVHLVRVYRCVAAAKREIYIPESATDLQIRRPRRYAAYNVYVEFVDGRAAATQIAEHMGHYLRRGWIVVGETGYDNGHRFHLTHPRNHKLEILISQVMRVSMYWTRDVHGARGFAWM